jgi:hypothetical protein
MQSHKWNVREARPQQVDVTRQVSDVAVQSIGAEVWLRWAVRNLREEGFVACPEGHVPARHRGKAQAGIPCC